MHTQYREVIHSVTVVYTTSALLLSLSLHLCIAL